MKHGGQLRAAAATKTKTKTVIVLVWPNLSTPVRASGRHFSCGARSLGVAWRSGVEVEVELEKGGPSCGAPSQIAASAECVARAPDKCPLARPSKISTRIFRQAKTVALEVSPARDLCYFASSERIPGPKAQ